MPTGRSSSCSQVTASPPVAEPTLPPVAMPMRRRRTVWRNPFPQTNCWMRRVPQVSISIRLGKCYRSDLWPPFRTTPHDNHLDQRFVAARRFDTRRSHTKPDSRARAREPTQPRRNRQRLPRSRLTLSASPALTKGIDPSIRRADRLEANDKIRETSVLALMTASASPPSGSSIRKVR